MMQATLVAAGVVVIIAGLAAAKSLLVPLILATLLSFLLAPLADRLERWRFPRVLAAVLVTALAFVVIAAVGYVVLQQAVELIASLPRYQRNIQQRVEDIEARTGPLLERASRSLEPFRALRREPPTPAPAAPVVVPPMAPTTTPQSPPAALPGSEPPPPTGSPEQPVTVRVQEPDLDPLTLLRDYAGTVLSPLISAGLVVIFVIFMLLQRGDLRDRIIRLIGQRRIYVTTHALGDAGKRISRYLLMQLIINLCYGVPVALGLWLIGLPGAALWGLLTTVLRFIPYLGPWLGATMPVALSLAVFPGWFWPFMVLGLFVTLELFSNNVMEPWLYGATTGMSPIAVLIAATFWSWLWGGVGLLLAVPITACLVVAGQHIAPLRFLRVLLGDKLALDPHVRLYQQLADENSEQAMQITRDFTRQHSRLELYDELVLPALHLTEQERHRGWLEPQQQQFIRRSMQQMVEQIATPKNPQSNGSGATVLCVGARDVADALCALMLVDLLRSRDVMAAALTRTQLFSGGASLHDPPPLLVISALPPSAAREALDLLKAWRRVEPRGLVIVGLWRGRLRSPRQRHAFARAGGHAVIVHSFADTLRAVLEQPKTPPQGPT